MSIDLEKLAASWPQEYAAVHAAGRAAGVAQERDRVLAHLQCGRTTGAVDLAAACVADGRSIQDVTAEYVRLGTMQRHIAERQEDEDAISGAANAAAGTQSSTAAGKSPGEIVADLVCNPAGRDARDEGVNIRPVSSHVGGRFL